MARSAIKARKANKVKLYAEYLEMKRTLRTQKKELRIKIEENKLGDDILKEVNSKTSVKKLAFVKNKIEKGITNVSS